MLGPAYDAVAVTSRVQERALPALTHSVSIHGATVTGASQEANRSTNASPLYHHSAQGRPCKKEF